MVEEALRAEGVAQGTERGGKRSKKQVKQRLLELAERESERPSAGVKRRRHSAPDASSSLPLEPGCSTDAAVTDDLDHAGGGSSSSTARPPRPQQAAGEAVGDAPTKSAEELEADVRAATRTETADLLRSWGTLSFSNTSYSALFKQYLNGAMEDPHTWWTRRLAPTSARADARIRKRVAVSAEIIVTVVVCNVAGNKDQEFDVLASQPLHELRDAFYFASDWMYDGPTRIKSGCFFIDGAFYSDRRDATSIEYSKEIIEWLKSTREPGFVRCETPRSMQMCLADLERIPFGERCVYIHQGDIEHSVYFSNARILNVKTDCPFREAYPMLTYMKRPVKRRCYACLRNYALWVIVDSSRCPHNPSYWCQECFRHFYQDAEGNYIQPIDYKVFPYLNDES